MYIKSAYIHTHYSKEVDESEAIRDEWSDDSPVPTPPTRLPGLSTIRIYTVIHKNFRGGGGGGGGWGAL